MSSANKVTFVYAVYRTNLYTRTATGTERVINSSKVINYGDCSVRTGLLTLHTTYTSVRAVFAGDCALILVRALYGYTDCISYEVNDLVRTLTCANSATDALLGIYASHAVDDRNCILRTYLYTISVTKTCIVARLITLVCHIGDKTA